MVRGRVRKEKAGFVVFYFQMVSYAKNVEC